MITMQQILAAVNYKITGGSEYTWNCFGPNARYLDCDDSNNTSGNFSIITIFDSVDQTVYALEAWDYVNNREYRWINPDFAKPLKKECKKNAVDFYESIDDRKFIDLDVPSDILEKISCIVANKPYDDRVKVEVDFSDEELLQYMKLAHEMDITFNELVERAITEAIEDYKNNPKDYKKKAKRFINENSGGE